MKKLCFFLLLGMITMQGCTNGDDVNGIIPITPDIDTLSLGVYVQDNQWIYSQMNHNYLWREDLPDSLSCNYLLDPVSFFKQLLSVRDRFSYCEHNERYEPDTRSITDFYNSGSVFIDSVFVIDNRRIGYLCYRRFDEAEELEPAMKLFYDSKITDLILDLRYNGGGLVSTCQYLCTSIVPENAYGQLMEYLKYNDIVTQERMKAGEDSVYSYNFKRATDGKPTFGPQIYGLRLNRLFVLVSSQTASASESTIICLKPYMDVITIGERTAGKGVGMQTLWNVKYKYKLVPITFRYFNAAKQTVPDDGLEPDVFVVGASNLNVEKLGEMDEPLLSVAIQQVLQHNLSLKLNKND